MAGIDQENLQYGVDTARKEAKRKKDNERISNINELFKELGLDAQALKKRGQLSQPKADELIRSALFDIGPQQGNGFHIENIEGIVATVQEHVAPRSYNPNKQFPDKDLLNIIHATDKVRDQVLLESQGKGNGRRYDVESGLGSSLGKVAEGMARGRTPGLGDVFGAVVGAGKAAMNAMGLQPSNKTGPLTLGDIRKAQIALVALNGVPEADARDALWAFQQMKPFVPANQQRVFDVAADRVRSNVAKGGPQVERDVRQDQRKSTPQTAPQPAGEEVDCSGLELIKSLADKAQGKPDAKNCKTPEVQSPTPTGPGGFSMGGG